MIFCCAVKELAFYGCDGFQYCLNLAFRIAAAVLDFSLFLTFAIIGYRACSATASSESHITIYLRGKYDTYSM